MGSHPRLPRSLHHLCRTRSRSNSPGCFRELVGTLNYMSPFMLQQRLTTHSVAPILVMIIAMWYKKNEQGRRVSWFYVCNSLTQIFGGFVAYGVSFTHGGFASWRIFYIAIGAMTMVIGLIVAIFLPDSPVKARRFTDAEKVAVLMRVKNNQRYPPVHMFPPSQEQPS